ncbi:hypothetical protein HDV63DRAFT_184668 [Trichoderma sp. SZMC 28014]
MVCVPGTCTPTASRVSPPATTPGSRFSPIEPCPSPTTAAERLDVPGTRCTGSRGLRCSIRDAPFSPFTTLRLASAVAQDCAERCVLALLVETVLPCISHSSGCRSSQQPTVGHLLEEADEEKGCFFACPALLGYLLCSASHPQPHTFSGTSSVCSAQLLAALPSTPFISFRLPSQAKIIYSQVPSKLTLHLGSPRPSAHDGTLTQPCAQSPTTSACHGLSVVPSAFSFTRVSCRETRQRIFLLLLNEQYRCYLAILAKCNFSGEPRHPWVPVFIQPYYLTHEERTEVLQMPS